ncbi:hypothetical protein H5410_005658, partial [Solanum commersonii]
MARIRLTRLCLQEEDHELEEVQCKHGFVLPLLTSSTPRNPSRRYWGCPYYGNARSCNFWLWKDDYVDPRSKFVIPKLLGRIAELEHSVESSRNVETSDKEINKPTKSTKSMESKIDMKESKMDNFDDDLKKMKAVEKKWKNKLAKFKKMETQLWIALLCVCILGKATYLKLIHEVNKGNYITFSVEPFGLPLPLPVRALGVALGQAFCVDIGAAAGPTVYVDVRAAAGPEGGLELGAAGPEGGLELGPAAGLELGPAVKLVPEA